MSDDYDDLIGGDAPERADDSVNRATRKELQAFIERIEVVELDIKASQGDRNDIYAEAKARGYDTKVMKKIVRLRKMAADVLAEEEAVEALYREVLGL